MTPAEKRVRIINGLFQVDGLITNINVIKYLTEDNNNETINNTTNEEKLQLFHNFNGDVDSLLYLNSQLIQENIIMCMFAVLAFAALFTAKEYYDLINSIIVLISLYYHGFSETIPYSIYMERLHQFILKHTAFMSIEYFILSRSNNYNLTGLLNMIVYAKLLWYILLEIKQKYLNRKIFQELIEANLVEKINND